MLYDITRPIEPGMAVWPGDTPYSHTWGMRLEAGDSVNVSALTLSAHTGTHADAPLHFSEKGRPIDGMALEAYLGAATVIALEMSGAIEPADLRMVEERGIARLLIKTPASLRPNDRWDDEFAYLSPAAAAYLVRCGVCLFGTDAASVDPVQSKSLDAHHILGGAASGSNPVAILEGLALADVPPGDYELIALPLKLGVDGSPVRAVLRTPAT